MKIIGIDPGTSNGGIAIYDTNTKLWTLAKMPKEQPLREVIKEWGHLDEVLVGVEAQTMRHQDRDSPAFFGIEKLIKSTERMKAYLSVHKIPFIDVYAVSWQSPHKSLIKETKDARKKRYQSVASGLVGRKVSLWGADAVLIAYYLQLKRIKDPSWIEKRLVKPDNRLNFGEK